MISTRTGGWIHRRGSDRQHLELNEKRGLFAADDVPSFREIKPFWMPNRNQGPVGSCAGFARCYVATLGVHELTGATLKFSANHAYRGAQKVDNIRGDRGSTIEGQMRHWQSVGLCLESTWPYNGRYQTNGPSEADREGADFKLEGYQMAKSVDDMIAQLLRRMAVDFGMMWTAMIDRQAKQNNGVIEEYGGSGGGGHSVSGMGLVLPETVLELTGHRPKSNDPYIWIMNSWGDDDSGVVGSSSRELLKWGHNGASFWSLKAMKQVLETQWNVAALPGKMVLSDETRKKYRYRPIFGGPAIAV